MADTPNIELASPLRLNTYKNSETGTQVFQWVTGDYEISGATRWRSVISGSNALVVKDLETTNVAEMYFTIQTNPSAAGAILEISQTPKLYVDGVEDGTCTYGGDMEPFSIGVGLFNSNALMIFRNGVKQIKGVDVSFVSDDNIQFTQRLQTGDVLTFDYIKG